VRLLVFLHWTVDPEFGGLPVSLAELLAYGRSR
jgi:hypothetical protein